jgi:hypothetical protein
VCGNCEFRNSPFVTGGLKKKKVYPLWVKYFEVKIGENGEKPKYCTKLMFSFTTDFTRRAFPKGSADIRTVIPYGISRPF